MKSKNIKSVMEMANGEFLRKVDREMAVCMDNIMDPDADPEGKRKIVVTIVLEPTSTRDEIAVSVQTKTTLQPHQKKQTWLSVTGDDATGEVRVVELVPELPGQMDMMGETYREPPILRLCERG